MANYVITVARGFGSGGKQISVELAKQLGISCYEREILRLASEQSGISEALFAARDEKLKGGYWRRRMMSVPADYAVEPMSKKFTHDDNLYNIQKEIILDIAKTESCIIVGKCADNIFINSNRVLKVFIDAPLKDCVRSITARMSVTPDEAEKLVLKTNKYRSDYYKYYTGGKDWRNPLNYDLCINTGFISREKCVEIIKEALRQKSLI